MFSVIFTVPILALINKMDDIEKCPICQQYKNTLLQLTCGHDPCISCAAVSFSRQKKLKSSISNVKSA
jgi:hypothetical protein